jgi:hypothetical protein
MTRDDQRCRRHSQRELGVDFRERFFGGECAITDHKKVRNKQ